MTEKAILVRYGEVWLKSDPVRRQFEQVLVGNIRSLFPAAKISVVPGRILVFTATALKELARVFGVVSYSPVTVCDRSMEAIKAVARTITKKWRSGTFAIRASRTDKSFPLTSKQIEIAVAEPVNLPVDLSNPKHTLSIEIRDSAYLYEHTVAGPGGLPLGSAGKIAARLRDSDDLIAAWLGMRRGALPVLIKPKPVLLKLLQTWAVGRKLRTAKSLKAAAKLGAIALVDVRNSKPKEGGLAVLNPLVGFGASEKAALLKKIRQE